MVVASVAADVFELDRVLFAPVGLQPMKREQTVASFEDRMAMIELCCKEDARFRASRIDAPRQDGNPNYTVDTLEHLAHDFPNARIYSIVGADSFLSIEHWREPKRLLELAEWIVVSRPGFSLDDARLSAEERDRVHTIDGVWEDVSATELRAMLREGKDCDGVMLPAVARYIALHGLYR
jgi:nicotinate-nucleotide adenylyltransferase